MLELLETAICYLTLLYATQALVPLFFPPSQAASKIVGISIQIFLYGAIASFSLLRWRQIVAAFKPLRFIALLIAVVILSTAWSQYMSLSLRRGAVLAASTLFGAYFAVRFSSRQQYRILAVALATAGILSILFVILLPDYGLDNARHGTAWRGVFYQKNELGRIMAVAVLLFLSSKTIMGKVPRWIGFGGACVVLLMSHSMTAVLVCTLTVACVPLLLIVRSRLTFAVPVLSGLLVVASIAGILVFSYQTELFTLLHRGTNLTGRTLIWSAVLPEIAHRPFFGYGYSAFWLRTTGESANVVSAISFIPLHSHNGFLDICLELGALGMLLFAASFFSQWQMLLKTIRDGVNPVWLWSAAFLVMLTFYNMAEGPLLRENALYWMLYTANAVNLASLRSEVASAASEPATVDA